MTRFTRFTPWLVLATVVAGMALIPSALAQSGAKNADSRAGLWFIELTAPPVAEGGLAALTAKQQADFRAAAKKAGVSFRERFAFSDLWNGLSIQSGADMATLKRVAGVKAVYPVLKVPMPEEQKGGIDPNLATALAMTGADIAQSVLGYDGSGVKVAVMDTGIDLDHPDLGGDGVAGAPYTNPRVVSQWDFVGDAYNADPSSASFNPTPAPDPIADDCNGHGTHVSGIVGANGAVKGVAPGVTFGAYRVFGCSGSTESDIMIAAMDAALHDGMDILNMSIGSAFNTWPQYPTAHAADNLVRRGMVVVASIGNSGADGVYSAGAPGVGNDVIGTASFDNTFVNLNLATVTPAGLNIGHANAAGAPPAPTSGSLSMTKDGTTSTTNDMCNATSPFPVLTGKITLIRRGGCTFYEKAKNAMDNGAAAVVLYNNSPGRFSPTVAGTPPITIPVVATSDTQGAAIDAAITSGAQTWNWSAGAFSEPNLTAGTISSFSSFGLNAELTLKPDIGAPGGLIRSTYPLEAGGYATISGTSMASPHVAGGAALLLEAKPNLKPKEVRDVLQNSADPAIRFGQSYLDNVHRQGAGLLDIDDAILATTTVRPGKVSLGEGTGGTFQLELANSSSKPVTYHVGHEPAAGTTNTYPAVAYSTDYASAEFSSTVVKVPANGTARVGVKITTNAAMPHNAVYGGYITFIPVGHGQEYRVPYAGMKGDYQAIQILTPTVNGFPWLSRLTACTRFWPGDLNCYAGSNYSQVPAASSTYSMADLFNVPHFLVHFNHQGRSLTAEVYRASDGLRIGEAFRDDYLPRNSAASSFFAYPWDGYAKHTAGSAPTLVPNGTYYMKLTVVKPLSTQTESWTSPNFVIARP